MTSECSQTIIQCCNSGRGDCVHISCTASLRAPPTWTLYSTSDGLLKFKHREKRLNWVCIWNEPVYTSVQSWKSIKSVQLDAQCGLHIQSCLVSGAAAAHIKYISDIISPTPASRHLFHALTLKANDANPVSFSLFRSLFFPLRSFCCRVHILQHCGKSAQLPLLPSSLALCICFQQTMVGQSVE